MKIEISQEVIESVMQYLVTKPWVEVNTFINQIQKDVIEFQNKAKEEKI